ncbi:unnamed protein product [Rotaria sordida]|uniref:Uncharacterized protein n=1 Tax=Rotaria sordida TaxID=392033 RepID=A0A813VKB2_9BILA|nr:unnamed protein product [Rotaria sordida]
MSENNEWNEELFGCCDDCGTCCYGFCCPACLFGSNAKQLDGSNCLVMCCIYGMLQNAGQFWLPHYFKREKLRRIYGLREDSTCGDVPATLCCGPCALCQEAREMKSRDHNANTNRSRGYQTTNWTVTSQPPTAKQPPLWKPDAPTF